MYRYNCVTLLVVISLLGTSTYPCQAGEQHSAFVFLKSAYRAMDEAASHRDVNKVLSYDSSDYTGKSSEGLSFTATRNGQLVPHRE
jgi:hypothetical protein